MPNYWLKRTADAAVEGPLTREQLMERVRLKHLTSAALISPDRSHWHPITAIKGLFPAIVSGSCLHGLSMLFMALAARSIQNGLNELWKQARSEMERSGDLGLPVDR